MPKAITCVLAADHVGDPAEKRAGQAIEDTVDGRANVTAVIVIAINVTGTCRPSSRRDRLQVLR